MEDIIFNIDLPPKISVVDFFPPCARIEEIKKLIEENRWQGALALALTIPDVCSSLSSVNNSNYAKNVGFRYKNWVEKYVETYYRISTQTVEKYLNEQGYNFTQVDVMWFELNKPYFDANKLYKLRNAFFHEGDNFIDNYNKTTSSNKILDVGIQVDDRFTFNLGEQDIINPLCVFKEDWNVNQSNTKQDLVQKADYAWVSLSVKRLCLNICKAYEKFYTDISSENCNQKLTLLDIVHSIDIVEIESEVMPNE